MSQKFGLDWQSADAERVQYLIAIHDAESEKQDKESKKLKQQSHGR